MIIGVTGTNGAGKGVLVDYLREYKEYMHYSVRDLIVEEVLRRGLPLDRTKLQEVGTQMRREHSPEYFAKTFVDRAQENHIQNAVIESIRTVVEAEYIKGEDGIIIAVDAPLDLRYKRITERGTPTDHVTFEEFQEQEQREYYAKDPNDPTQMSVLKVIDIADHVILNDGTLEDFRKRIDDVLKALEERS